MAYTNSPSTSYLDRLRLRLGDIDSVEILSDDTYTYFYTKNDSNENRAYRELLPIMLMTMTRFVDERAGDIQVFGSARFRAYYDAVKLALSNPDMNSYVIVPYAGGISRTDMAEKANDADAVDKPFYIGCTQGVPSYANKTVYESGSATSAWAL